MIVKLFRGDPFRFHGCCELGWCACESCAGVACLETEGEAVAGAVSCCAEEGDTLGLGGHRCLSRDCYEETEDVAKLDLGAENRFLWLLG